MSRLRQSTSFFIVAASSLVLIDLLAGKNSALASSDSALQKVERLLGIPDETDVRSPIDYGAGPGIKRAAESAEARSALKAPSIAQIPIGGATANITGTFGPAITWPLIPIHVVLLPDGRVMSYGTDGTGAQTAQFIYDVWDPSLGTDTSSHLVLPNTTNTDIFCGAQSLMVSGDVLTGGGDLTVAGVRNSANNDTNIFSPTTNTLTANTPMAYARWYSSLVALPNGKLTIFGGRQNVGSLSPTIPATIPELYDPAVKTWTPLTGANNSNAFGSNWFYPRAYVAPGGDVFVLSFDGTMYYVTTDGSGGITQSPVTVPGGDVDLPTVAFAPGMALSVRNNQAAVVVDYRTSTPVVTATDNIDQVRYWSSGSIMADGQVLVTGGSQVANVLTGVAYQAQLWNPKTGHWTGGAVATKPRLYHSNSLLLPDATVLTGGGGAPGPVTNLNAEIYYPPYLYAADGSAAARPSLTSTSAQSYDPGDTLSATVGSTDVISRLTFVRTGSSTHSNDSDQRFIDLAFNQQGQSLVAVLPSDTSLLLPGFYMLFAFNSAGVPSVARIVNVTANAVVAPVLTLSPSTLVFPAQAAGSAGAALPVTVNNTTGASLPAPRITITGVYAAQFSQTNTCGSSIPAKSSCTINVVFEPAGAGSEFATLHVNGAGLKLTTQLKGTGVVPYTVTPALVPFGSVKVNTRSASQSVTVANQGIAALPIANIALTGADPSQFVMTNGCGSSLAAGSSCAISVVFAPTTTGNLSVRVLVTAEGSTHPSRLTGKGTLQ